MVEREEANERTAGGVVLPDNAKEKLNRGRVVAVGDGKLNDEGKRVPLKVKLGDRVLFDKYAGDEFKFDDSDVLLIHESDLLAVIR
jgi:chaperonin GroES